MTTIEKIDRQVWLILETIEEARLASPKNWATLEWSYDGRKIFDPHIAIPKNHLLEKTGLDSARISQILFKLEQDGYIKQIYQIDRSDYERISLTESFTSFFKQLEAKYSKVTETEPKLRFDPENGVLHKDGIDETAYFEDDKNMSSVLEAVFSVSPLERIQQNEFHELDALSTSSVRNAIKNINAKAKRLGIHSFIKIDKGGIMRTQ